MSQETGRDAISHTKLGGNISNWLNDRMLVKPKVYLQQKEMYESGTHRCEDRIVSLPQPQPHVRLIVRGKRADPTEFGQKLHLRGKRYTFKGQTCWNNFNEGNDLPVVIKKLLLADKLCQTRNNRNYCKARGKHLSGSALGRKSKAAKEENEAQMY